MYWKQGKRFSTIKLHIFDENIYLNPRRGKGPEYRHLSGNSVRI
jgi:hypothetical protein